MKPLKRFVNKIKVRPAIITEKPVYKGPRMGDQSEKPAKKLRANYTKEEQAFIEQLAIENEEPFIDLNFLEDVAKQCNIHFHDKRKFRHAEGLWWMMKRSQDKNQGFSGIELGNSPRRLGSNGQPARAARGESKKTTVGVSSALKHPLPPRGTQRPSGKQPLPQPKITLPKSGTSSHNIVVLQDSKTGNLTKMKTSKSIEEIMIYLVS